MLMTLLDREMHELPVEILFSNVKLRTLHAYKKKELKPPLLLGETVQLVAKKIFLQVIRQCGEDMRLYNFCVLLSYYWTMCALIYG
jgi:hypothetical protein